MRENRRLTDAVQVSLEASFDALYAASGRPSIAPEYVLRALLLRAFCSVRSERQLVEQLGYNLLFRWFVGLDMGDAAWSHAVFSKNHDRLLTSEVAQQFFAEVNRLAKRSDETHQSKTDPDARFSKKSYGKESKLAYLGHTLVENRHGLIAAAVATEADGYAERDAALLMLHERQKNSSRRIPVGADKAYDTKDFVAAARALHVTPHV
ncbi:transposase [Granulicella arctica]|uniref:Transposase n=1 Tax=Granulicella arctica TaxID=940613 RepID=A0A7Y9TGF1_9BACT|nr:transposase [Granulicella arctica]